MKAASAPGKLLLFGDHAVVYGYPCIVTAVSERLTVQPGESAGDTRFMDAAVAAWGRPGQKFHATSSFSGIYGLGSSAAVTVATLQILRPEATKQEIFETAYDIVLDIQGVGSGADVAAATHGGTLYYIKDKIIESVVVSQIPLIVGYTGVKADTVSMIQNVEQKKDRAIRLFEAITKIVNEAKEHMRKGNWERVGKLMDFNQEYLRDLGVSSEKLETLIAAAKRAGAWGAKLSGAGGGDCMIALAPPEQRTAVEQAIAVAGGEVIHITAGAPGVRSEQ